MDDNADRFYAALNHIFSALGICWDEGEPPTDEALQLVEQLRAALEAEHAERINDLADAGKEIELWKADAIRLGKQLTAQMYHDGDTQPAMEALDKHDLLMVK